MASTPCITKELVNASWGTLILQTVLSDESLWNVLHVDVQKL